MIDWLESHNYKCPSISGKTPLERELGIWINNVRKAKANRNPDSGTMVLDHRRRRYLEAINFVWKGVKGRGAYMRFPDDWEIRMENDSGGGRARLRTMEGPRVTEPKKDRSNW